MAAVLVVSVRGGLTGAVVLALEAVVLASEAAVYGYWAVAASEANTTASKVSTTALVMPLRTLTTNTAATTFGP